MPWLHERLRGDRRRWPLSVAVALVLLWFGGQFAADLYPRGRLYVQQPPRLPARVLNVLPPLEIMPDEAVPLMTLTPTGPLPMRPADTADFWSSLVIVPDDALLAPPPVAPPPPLLTDPRLSWWTLPADTSRAALLRASALLQGSGFADWQRWGAALNHGWRAGNHEARKRTIFGEDWLEAQPLKEEPTQRR